MKKEVIIPESLDDLTLEQWQKIQKVVSEEGVSDEFLVRTILRVVYGIKSGIIEHMKAKDIENLLDSYRKIVDQQPVFKQRFTLNGIEYGFIPNLDEITAGELVDLDSYAKDVNTHQKMMSILYRPIKDKKGKDYSIKKYKGSNDDLLRMPLGIYLGATAFFLRLGMELQNSIIVSLKVENPVLLVQALEKSGDGISLLTPSQMAMYCDLTE